VFLHDFSDFIFSVFTIAFFMKKFCFSAYLIVLDFLRLQSPFFPKKERKK